MRDRDTSRRRFVILAAKGTLLTAAVAAASQAVRFLAFEPPDSTVTVFPVGQPDSYPRDTLVYVAEARAYVGHDDGGLYAVDAVCPHLGCLVEQAEKGGYVCPCHASRFDAAGGAVSGPATQPLRFLRIRLDQDQLVIDRAEPVSPDVRLTL